MRGHVPTGPARSGGQNPADRGLDPADVNAIVANLGERHSTDPELGIVSGLESIVLWVVIISSENGGTGVWMTDGFAPC
jgi:hypothetical protein